MATTALRPVRDFVGGRWIEPKTAAHADVHNPATGELLARVPMGGAADVDAAGPAPRARRSRPGATRPSCSGRATSSSSRRCSTQRVDDIARIVTLEHGKTLDESRGSVRRGDRERRDRLRACPSPCRAPRSRTSRPASTARPSASRSACSPPSRRSTSRRWCRSGSCRTRSRCGNTFVVKPSERVPLSQKIIFEMLARGRLPAGRRQPGQRRARTRSTRSSTIPASRASRSSVRRRSRTTSTSAGAERGKRVQALGRRQELRGGHARRRHGHARARSRPSRAFGCAGERCLANSVVLAVGDAYEKVRDGLLADARNDQGRQRPRARRHHGPGDLEGSTATRSSATSRRGIAEGAKLLLDGRGYRDPKHAERLLARAVRSSTASRPR